MVIHLCTQDPKATLRRSLEQILIDIVLCSKLSGSAEGGGSEGREWEPVRVHGTGGIFVSVVDKEVFPFWHFFQFYYSESQRSSQGRSSCSRVLCQGLEIPTQQGNSCGATHIRVTSSFSCWLAPQQHRPPHVDAVTLFHCGRGSTDALTDSCLPQRPPRC